MNFGTCTAAARRSISARAIAARFANYRNKG
jgi:hypothetical protein